jgi:hypothetical protein
MSLHETGMVSEFPRIALHHIASGRKCNTPGKKILILWTIPQAVGGIRMKGMLYGTYCSHTEEQRKLNIIVPVVNSQTPQLSTRGREQALLNDSSRCSFHTRLAREEIGGYSPALNHPFIVSPNLFTTLLFLHLHSASFSSLNYGHSPRQLRMSITWS